jgi:hypothetical protein
LGDASHLVDNLHPDQKGHDLIAARFLAQAGDLVSELGRLARTADRIAEDASAHEARASENAAASSGDELTH